MSVIKKIFVALIVIVVLVVAAVAVAINTVDINQYREQIADALSKQTGRTVKFGGPIKLAVTSHGIGIAVENASLGNPSWASRPQMASIGKLNLGVALMPLLNHQYVVSELDVSNADIQLETNAQNQHNWDLKPSTAATPVTNEPAVASNPAQPAAVGVRVNELSIMNSQLAMRDKDGKTSIFKVGKMTLTPEGHSTSVSLDADYNGTPIKLTLKATTDDLLAGGKWPYNADLTYAAYHLHAQGTADTAGKEIELNPYEFTTGNSSLHGQLMADFGGTKTKVRGSVMGDKLDTADLKPPADGSAAANAPSGSAQQTASGSGPLFSTAPLDLSALKSAEASIDVAIEELKVGKTTLKQANGKIALAGGVLTLDPLKGTMGTSALEANIKLNAAVSPAQYTFAFKAPGVDLANLWEAVGAPAFMTGKGDADIQLSGSGSSLHDMAASTDGHITITAANGTISSTATSGIASSLAQILSPGSGNPTLNCFAARFNVANGVGKDNGILADSSASTVAGFGGFDLGKENVDLTLNAKPKVVNTRGLMPAILVSGPLLGPNIGINAASTAQNVAGDFLKGNKIAGAISGALGGNGSANTIPPIQTAPDGQNACIYSLDHKSAAPAATAATPATQNKGIQNTLGNPASSAKKLGNQLLQGIMGH